MLFFHLTGIKLTLTFVTVKFNTKLIRNVKNETKLLDFVKNCKSRSLVLIKIQKLYCGTIMIANL